jgi:hypothetical protein
VDYRIEFGELSSRPAATLFIFRTSRDFPRKYPALWFCGAALPTVTHIYAAFPKYPGLDSASSGIRDRNVPARHLLPNYEFPRNSYD